MSPQGSVLHLNIQRADTAVPRHRLEKKTDFYLVASNKPQCPTCIKMTRNPHMQAVIPAPSRKQPGVCIAMHKKKIKKNS